jgi:N6-adenosine-specific RNA methylase IME4
MNKEITIQNEDWYQALSDECSAIITETVFVSRWTMIEGHHKLGKRIIEDSDKAPITELVKRVSVTIGKSERMLWKSVQFARKYPDINDLPDGKNISLRKIFNELLVEPQKQLPLPKGKYSIIYADPPWQYWEGGEKNQSRHYKTMEIEEIKELPISDLAGDNCILFLWATFPYLKEAQEVIESWGFKYSTVGFVWIKSLKDGTGFAFGNGSWTRANAELCLIATKGQIERQDASISQIIYLPKEKHSKKPDIVRDKIIQLVGDLPRIELFARQPAKGWKSWGNEI